MAHLQFRHVAKIYGKGVRAVDGLDFTIPHGEFTVIVGPSGCGKSTVLRMMAGLEDLTEGEFFMDGVVMNPVPPQKRETAMVFQSYALYPHLSVYGNMAFPLKLRKMPKDVIDRRVVDVARSLDLESLLQRMPRELSGGQRQRVALGRAMVREPKVFLFDEPLSNLDAKLRAETRIEIAQLHRRLKTNFVYVTHDQVEAVTMGEKIMVMKDGRLRQYATPGDLMRRPADCFVAGFIGTPPMNFLTMHIEQSKDGLYLTSGRLRIMATPGHVRRLVRYKKNEVIVGIRPKDLYLKRLRDDLKPDEDMQSMAGRFILKESLGDDVLYYLDVSPDFDKKQTMIVKDDAAADADAGEPLDVCVDAKKIYLFDADTEKAIPVQEEGVE
ncbi:MAG: ATP-binding cassette domain-containing protein [Deltaproteobacteria bacterium]|nr:ATP-binding cassette domain-containing protein [Deltaproteobacteria bacterium]